MNENKDQLREVIIQLTAEKMAPILAPRVDTSKKEMIEAFKRLVHFGRVKIGVMPFESEEEAHFHSVTFVRMTTEDHDDKWMSLETGNPVDLEPGLERVFTLTEQQYQQVYGTEVKS